MGKTLRWFRALLGAKRSSPASKEKKKYGNVQNIGGTKGSNAVEEIDANNHAIAVAAATAAVAEAALAAAKAAAEVVRLTSGGGTRPTTANVSGSVRRRQLAAVTIQSAFRAYLVKESGEGALTCRWGLANVPFRNQKARRALRALKGLVRLQALVRGHIVRKQSADMLRRMQALARIQARACANRAHVLESSHSTSKSSQSHNLDLATPKKYDNQLRAYGTKSDRSPILKSSLSSTNIEGNVDLERTHLGSNWLDRWMEEYSWNTHGGASLKIGRDHDDDERSDKVLEVDTWKPRLNYKQSYKFSRTPQHVTACNSNNQGITIFDSLSRQSTKALKQNPCVSSGEVFLPSKFPKRVDHAAVWTSENSASSRPGSSGRRGSFTPARSECSRSLFSEYLGYPNYMANTESSRAKVRSNSAPRQRLQVENFGSTTRFARGFWDADTISERGSALHSNFRTKAHPGCGHLDRPGTPVPFNNSTIYNSIYGGRS